MKSAHALLRPLERFEGLDRVIGPVSSTVNKGLRPTLVRNALSGTWLGHPVHPMLVSLPIGAWAMSALFDAVGGQSGNRAANVLIGTGIAASVPTAATGLNDWSDTVGPTARVGAVHGATNSAALLLYLGSLTIRLNGRNAWGKALSWTGTALLAASGYLGGHLTYARATNINHAAWSRIPAEWGRGAAASDLSEGAVMRVERTGVPILLQRGGGMVTAIAATCTHMGGALDQGQRSGDCIACPLHGSTFRIDDGAVVRGPASSPQPVFEARIVDDAIEVRSAD